MTFAEFIRLYPLRAKTLAWFFGAGSSVSAGLPTANDLIWDFKKRIYCSEQKIPLTLFSNLSDPAIRNQIQAYFDSKGNFPKANTNEEYSFYFELAFPNARDRSDFLMQQLSGMQNSYGHKVIGTLLKNGLIKLIFTTNFDKAFENAAVEHFPRMDDWFLATMDNTDTSAAKYHSGLRPYIAKIHGDYFSEKLKNTSTELIEQDNKLRDILYHSCLSNGMAIMGYSGRDESIMEIFNKALDNGSSFPSGIFWFIRSGSESLPAVSSFINKAKTKNVQAELIEIETFDTAWSEILKGIETIPKLDMYKLNNHRLKSPNIQLPGKGTRFPYIRFNAITIKELPTTARLVKCNIGGSKEVKLRIAESKTNIIGIRKKSGIIGFGADQDFETAFMQHSPLEKDVFQIFDRNFADEESVIKGLITEGVLLAITRGKPLISRKRKERYLILPNPKQLNDSIFSKLKAELSQNISGKIPNSNIDWIVACEVSLQQKLSQNFLLLKPTIIAGKVQNESDRHLISPFVKEAMARWYNEKFNNLFNAWIEIIFAQEKEITISAFDESLVGFNAIYKLERQSPYTKTN